MFNDCFHYSLPLRSMSRFIFNLHSGDRLCHRCGRPSNLFGSRDAETNWMGWCRVCNADWHHHNVVSSICCCSRACSVVSPVVCGLGFYIPLAVAIKIIMYLFVDQTGAMIHTLTMRRRKCTLQLLEWTSARLYWFLADDSRGFLIPRGQLDDPPTLLSLRYEPHACRSFADLDHTRTVLEYIYTFLSPCFKTALHSEYHAQQEEVGWEMYQCNGRLWLWNNDTALWFFVDQPPSCWHRYCWFVDFPRTASSLKYWWHNADRGHWFWEPAVPTVQHATFEVDRDMMLRAHSLP